eukprot:1330328-Rhodomonas_salina.3
MTAAHRVDALGGAIPGREKEAGSSIRFVSTGHLIASVYADSSRRYLTLEHGSGSSIRQVSTGHRVASTRPYRQSVPHIASAIQHISTTHRFCHTTHQYHTSRRPYSTSGPHFA